MNSPDEITELILASLADSSVPGENEALPAIARAIKHMSVFRVIELRARIVSELDPESPAVRETLDTIDGQVALREIAGTEGWR